MTTLTLERLDYPKREIWLHVTSRAEQEMRIRSCAKEPETVEWIESLEPGVFYDLGANVGAYSFVAAANGHKVYAFEPPGPTFFRLEENAYANPSLEVLTYPVLLGDENAMVPFSYSSLEPGAALHSLGAKGEDVKNLEMRTLDLYVATHNLPYPQALKIDVDGAELRVLIGAALCLGHATAIQMEVDDDLPSSQQAEEFLKRRGFVVTSRTRHGGGPISNVRFDRDE